MPSGRRTGCPGSNAAPARALLDSIAAAVAAKRPRAIGRLARERFAAALGNEAKLELPKGALDLAEGKAIYERSCASCHGALGLGDGAGGARDESRRRRRSARCDAHARRVRPALMYRIVSVGIAGTPMAGCAGTLTAEQRWNVVAYLNSLRVDARAAARGRRAVRAALRVLPRRHGRGRRRAARSR